MQKDIWVEGMTCTNCTLSVEKSIQKAGGKNIKIDFASGKTSFELDNEKQDDAVKKAIENAGYKVKEEEKQQGKWTSIEKLFAFCLLFTLPLFIHMFVPKGNFLNHPFLQIALVLPVIFTGGWHFFKSAFNSLKSGVPNMDVLISVGVLAAFFYSLSGVILHYNTPELHDFLFFETAATIITLVLLGNVLEHRAVLKTTSAIKNLKQLEVQEVKVWRDNEWKNIELETVKVKDIIQVFEGDRIPVNGKIIKGKVQIDESLISGESEPLFKEEESEVFAGSVVLEGNAQFICTANSKNSTLQQIIDLVSNAQHEKPQIQKLGDKISAIFVPIVLGISLLTFLLSYFAFNISMQQSILQSVAVLVISCPCAMGLAAPTAVMVGVGILAKKGGIIKGGITLEKLSKVDTVVFDKTGTLTNGEFVLKEIKVHGETTDEATVKSLMLALEQKSNHPIAQSITKILNQEKVVPHQFEFIKEVKGKGVIGKDEGGNEFNLCSAKLAKDLLNAEVEGNLVLIKDGEKIAEIWIEDHLKEGAQETVKSIQDLGLEVIMLSGDQKQKCEAIAKTIGIQNFYYEQSPKEKLDFIKKLNQEKKVLMVGDGINDAPALANSYMGASFGKGTDVAVNSSDVVLMNNQLKTLINALEIGKKTYSTIKQNFFWAFFYNVIAIPVAALGFLIPIYAALAMAFSDVIVIGNSLRLKRFK